MAEKAFKELTATVRAYSMGGDQSIVRGRMFGEMSGMLKNAQNSALPPWPDNKTDFFFFVLVRLARCIKDESSLKEGSTRVAAHAQTTLIHKARRGSVRPDSHGRPPGGSRTATVWGDAPVTGLKEVLYRDKAVISLQAVHTVVDAAVIDPQVSAELINRLETHKVQEGTGLLLHLDDVLEIVMQLWDEQDEKAAPKLDEHLQKLFLDAAVGSNGRMSFAPFEKFITSLSTRGTDEDRILDIFDEAIRLTQETSGEETDTVSAEGFARVARLTNLVSMQNFTRLVDAIEVSRQEQDAHGKHTNDGNGQNAHAKQVTDGANALRRERSKRTVIKTSLSKSNERSGNMDKSHSHSLAVQKPERVYNVIREAVQSHFLFRHLDDAMHRELVQRMVPVPVMPGYDVIKQGDKGDYFYVAETGTFDVIVNDEKVHTYHAGDGKYPCFGELALLYAKPRAATIRAAGPGMLWGLDRRGFRSVQMFSSNVDLTKLLRRMDILSSLPFNSLQTLMNHMVEQTFGAGEQCFGQGDEGDFMYVIMSGTAVVTQTKGVLRPDDMSEEGEEEEIMQLEAESYFGERALLDNAPRAAAVRAITPLKCVKIDRTTFERLLGPLQHIIDSDRQRREFEAASQKMQLEAAGLSGASFASFQFRAPVMRLDTGGLLASHHIGTSETYTVRAESKVKLHEMDQTERVQRELEIMRATGLNGHLPMLPAMLCTFASPLALFSLFKTRISCELTHFMELMGGTLPTAAARYVAACVIAALERLHSHMGTVYRNLSPDALAVDEYGCVCLMDFRLAKSLSGRNTFTLCGVADYLAPEQVTCSGHGLAVDFWGLGILLWEICAGEGPWGSDNNEMNIYKRITDHEAGAIRTRLQEERNRGFLPPDGFVPTLIHLLDHLLVPDPTMRLGASEGAHGFKDLKGHAWLARINWSQLADGLVPSPLITSATTHMREQIELNANWSSDAVLGEVIGTKEYTGDGCWFAHY